jgi:hypothetical protein
MLCWQLRGEVPRRDGRERLAARLRAVSNRKFPVLEMLQLIETIDRRTVLIANFRESR